MANRLINETSPYLLQHAHNPVDWYPWGDEAFDEATRRNVPVLLSIGYSACHWCHVMERESFANPVVAARINTLFVPVKVDREERPDVDDVYMRAVQAFNRGHGGWPMTVFLTPDRQPFFGGTYFPPVSREGLPSFVEVLSHVSDVWRKQPSEVERITAQVSQLLQETTAPRSAARTLARDWIEQVVKSVRRDFDDDHGGFGDAPKFPAHGTLSVLLTHHRRTGDAESLAMVTATLDGMAKGGMYDVVGGGFARYSVDDHWRVPHFEKMLYDNAQLVSTYVDAYRLTGAPHYARIARETVAFLLRDLGPSDLVPGGFAASIDADSPPTDGEGEAREGAFYVFTPRQLRDILGPSEGARAAFLLQVTPDGTFEHGASVLRLEQPLEKLHASDRAFLTEALPKIFQARESRPRPARDDKRILSWNALVVSALARASALEPAWANDARDAAEFLLAHLRVDGSWRRIYMDGRASAQPAFVDDHANLLAAFLDLYEATFEPRWIAEAEAVADQIVSKFWDEASGTLFLAGHDQTALIARSRAPLGGAEPSPVGTTALGFVRLGKLIGRDDLLDRASALLRSVQFALGRAARTLGNEAIAGAWLTSGGAEVALAGDRAAIEPLLAEVRSRFLPLTLVAHVPPAGAPSLPWTAGKEPLAGAATAYVCEGFSCLLPTTDPATLAAQLEERMSAPPPSTTSAPEVRVHAPALPASPEAWLNTDAPLSIERLAGQVVVLDFWTSCCVNCQHVLPELAAVEERYAGQPVVVIGVHSAKFTTERGLATVRRAIERHGVRHPVVNDPERAVWDEYAIRSWPTTVVLDPTGRIAYQRSGEYERGELFEVIDRLLDEASGGLAAPMATTVAPNAAPEQTLRFPGRIHVWPDAFEQEGGADLFDAKTEARVYVSDSGHNRILECTLGADAEGWPVLTVVRTFGSGAPGLADGPADQARFRGPQGVRRYGRTLYVADTENHALRAVDLVDGTVRTLAGTGRRGTGAPTPEGMASPTTLDLRSPWDVEVMMLRSHPLVFVAMAGAHQLWVYANGNIGIHVGSGHEDHIDGPAATAALAQPSGLSLLGRYLLFVDAETSSIRAADLQSHQVMTVVGRGLFDFGDRDGPADQARLQHPLGITFAEDVVYVADTYNHKVKTVGLGDGRTTTVVGGSTDVLCEPGGVARAGGLILVADTGNHRIRAVDPTTAEIRDVPLL